MSDSDKSAQIQKYLDNRSELETQKHVSLFYSEFRDKEDNPTGWNSKMSSWMTIITDVLDILEASTFSVDQILPRLARYGLKPVCLPTVMTEMIERKQIQSLELLREIASYNNNLASDNSGSTWSGWLVQNFVQKPLTWVSSPLKSKKPQEGSSTTYVYLDRVSKQAQQLFDLFALEEGQISISHANVVLMDELLKNPKVQEISTEKPTIDLLISYLCSEKRAIVFSIGNTGKHAVKFVHNNENFQLLAEDRRTSQIYHTLKLIEQKVSELDQRINKCTQKAKEYKASNNVKQSLSYLAQRKRLSELRADKMLVIDNLTQIMDKIDEAHTNKEVMEAYKLGTQTLKDITHKYGLTAEAVDDVILELSEALANQREIDDAIGKGLADDTDMDELEKELELLTMQEKVQKEPQRVEVVKEPVQAPAETTEAQEEVTEETKQTEKSEPAKKQAVLA